ncbi:carbohydrate ABC transporter substrate-binding protein [Bacillus sp. ISL-40]|uniref:ABC transporter substrate-binding protein n=1 Tax=unclassified Bacillus (in: firmicutes) TaxID=185979 RepID=UPI001BE68256|nr:MULTISPECIES: ABC transporter substrate-binding protein [unclassified Bacillus (in: firmicutes)]MBT2700924.1 carbohydrate ABC transporter substrate-binding protein [Bacillus sp. ISL-40]MBT2742979.1 carbohydrate ABC transporter substrate-binding protein [Bacillus sp. ISL-77]
MKKLLFSTLSLVMVFFAGGCGKFNLADSAESKGKEEITIRIAWWGEHPRHDYTLEVIELFEKKYPNINVEPLYANWDDYWKRLAPMAAGNQLPDIIQMDLLYLRTYSENHLLEDLTPYINQETIKTETISEGILTGGKIGGNLYGFPLGLNAPAIVVDPNLLSSDVANYPKANWTWSDFEEIVLQVHKEKQIYGTNGMKSPDVFFSYYLRTKGMNLYNNSGTGLGYENDQLFIDYFKMQLRLLENGAFPRTDVTEQIKAIEDELLVKQQSPMQWVYSNQYFGFLEATNRQLDLIPPPGPGQELGLTVKPSMLFSMSDSSKHKEAAAKFINFFINDIQANRLIKGERGVPISTHVIEKIDNDLTDIQKKVFDYVNNVRNTNQNVEKADPLGSIEVVKILQDVSERILFKKISPEEGAQIFRTEANKILSNKN